MKRQRKLIIGISIVIIIIFIIATIIYNKNKINIINTKGLNSERMTDSSRITELEKQIDSLNKEHTSYAEYIQASKSKIATAITNNGVTTSPDDTADTMANNIGKILDASKNELEPFIVNLTISKSVVTSGSWPHTPTGTLEINGNTIFSITGGEATYNTTGTMATSEVYTIPETGQQVYITVQAEGNRLTNPALIKATTSLYVNGKLARSLSCSSAYNVTGTSSSDDWNIAVY